MKLRILIFMILVALVVGGLLGYLAGISSRHISPVEEKKIRPAIGEGGAAQDIKDFFNSLTNEQRACLESSLGKGVYDELSTVRRFWPGNEEFESIKSCTELKSWPPGSFAYLPQGYEGYTWKPDWEVNKR